MTDRSAAELRLLRLRFPSYEGEIADLVDADVTAYGHLREKAVSAAFTLRRPTKQHLKKFAEANGYKADWIADYDKGILGPSISGLIRLYYKAAWEHEKWLGEATDDEVFALLRKVAEQRKVLRETRAAINDKFAWFNLPEHDLDWPYWSGTESLTPDEATAIALGKDPRTVRAELYARLIVYLGPCLPSATESFYDQQSRLHLRRTEQASCLGRTFCAGCNLKRSRLAIKEKNLK